MGAETRRTKNDGPEHLDSNGNAVRAAVLAFLGSVGNTRGEQNANSDAELVARDDCASNLLRGNLGHVEDDDSGDEADTETGYQASRHDQAKARGRSRLENDANDEDDAAQNDGRPSTGEIGDIASNDGAKEGTGGQNGDNQGLVGS